MKAITDVPLPKVRRNLAVLVDLAREGIPVPAPCPADDGEFVAEVGGHGCCVLPWVDGERVQGEIPLTVAGLDGIGLKPEEIAHVLRGAVEDGALGNGVPV
ncbi:hypothetical protein ACGFX2_16250 [Streptomyces goshikiensis]|uniref:hypothetical protein n=1 Tax=Streptomyces goshikiensis TaxID=1942 RepID=UPI0037103867